ncbi:Uncharacterised protein [Bordetella holmesii]|nr:Uncharacterised protein [Bordetella holmesii]
MFALGQYAPRLIQRLPAMRARASQPCNGPVYPCNGRLREQAVDEPLRLHQHPVAKVQPAAGYRQPGQRAGLVTPHLAHPVSRQPQNSQGLAQGGRAPRIALELQRAHPAHGRHVFPAAQGPLAAGPRQSGPCIVIAGHDRRHGGRQMTP